MSGILCPATLKLPIAGAPWGAAELDITWAVNGVVAGTASVVVGTPTYSIGNLNPADVLGVSVTWVDPQGNILGAEDWGGKAPADTAPIGTTVGVDFDVIRNPQVEKERI